MSSSEGPSPPASKSVVPGLILAGLATLLAATGGWLLFLRETEPVAEEEEAAAPTLAPVHVAKVQRATLRQYAEGYGRVEAEPAHEGRPSAEARVASPLAGVLAESRCAEGDVVVKDALLFQLDTRAAVAEASRAAASAAATRATLERIRSAADFATTELERERHMAAEGLVSDQEVQAAALQASATKSELTEAQAKVAEAERAREAAETQRALLAIRSPLAGTVVQVFVNPGEAVETTTVLADIVDLERLVVTASLPARDLGLLRAGQPASVDAGGEPLSGTVVFVGLRVDPKTDAVPVRASLAPGHGLRPGQSAHLRVAVEEHTHALAVPVASVVKGPEGASFVFLVEGDVATRKAVTAGLRDGPLVEVSGEGLTEGAAVVTIGAYGLPERTRVVVSPE